jgi:putative hydrolase of the HAD superfamily
MDYMTKVSGIRAVVLDYGEVLCFAPDAEARSRMAAVFGVAVENFMERYVPTRGPYDQGLLTPEQYWRGIARESGIAIDGEKIARLREWDTAMWSRVNEEMIGWTEKLHAAGLTTALLSNMQHDMAAHARRNFAWLAHFDHQILSCELLLIKPDAAIFERTIERLGMAPQEILFVDDREPNVEAARRVGIRALQFRSVEVLRDDLEEMGFGVLPASRR